MNSPLYDEALTFAVVLSFAALVTAHAAAVFGLARRRHFAQALGGLVVPPLAPYWAFTGGMRARALTWGACAALYAIAFLLAR